MKQLLSKIISGIGDFFQRKFHNRSEEIPFYITIALALIIFALALKGFIEITDELAENELENFDSTISEFVISFRTETLTPFFKFMTEMGDQIAYTLISITLGAYFFVRDRSGKFILQTLLVLALATASNVFLKHLIHRERPGHEHLVTVNTLSFPSGHSMSAMAFYGFLIYLCLVSQVPKTLKMLLTILLSLIIFLVGLSRIYLGVHFPSDVAAGFAGGLIWVTFCAIVFNIISLWRKRRSRVQNP